MTVYNVNRGELDAWVRKTDSRLLAVAKESTKRVVQQAQRRIPVDTGFAKASVVGSLGAMPNILTGNKGEKNATYSDSFQWIVAIAAANLGDTISIGWTAEYVGLLEHGWSRQAPSGFVRISAMEWPRIVSEVTQEAKARTP